MSRAARARSRSFVVALAATTIVSVFRGGPASAEQGRRRESCRHGSGRHHPGSLARLVRGVGRPKGAAVGRALQLNFSNFSVMIFSQCGSD